MVKADTVFKAIAHPARRQILKLLAETDCSVTELTRVFKISQPAVSQHLRELRAAELVTSEKVGLQRRYRLTADPIRIVFEWSSEYKQFFDPAGHAWALVPATKGQRIDVPGKGKQNGD